MAEALKDALRPTPQSEALPGQVANQGGGYAFEVDPWQRFRRFLILGTEGGSYYVGERELTLDHLRHIRELLAQDPSRVIDEIVEVSDGGLAPKNDQALFALAVAASAPDTSGRSVSNAALNQLPKVARTGTHLLFFVHCLKQMRGFGRSVKRALEDWYIEKGRSARKEVVWDWEGTAYQVIKYRNRHGWTHRDVLRLAHPNGGRNVVGWESLNLLFRWITQGAVSREEYGKLPTLAQSFLRLQGAPSEEAAVEVLRSDKRLSHDMVPGKVKGAKVWEELMFRLPQTALIRNLPTMTRLGLLKPLSEDTSRIADRVKDEEYLIRSRVHPLNLLLAQLTYASGRSLRGSAEWTPTPLIKEALETAFYGAFGSLNIYPETKVYLGVDVSGSMFWGQGLMGVPNLTPAMGAAAMALVLRKQYPTSYIRGFSQEMVDLGFTERTSLGEAERTMYTLPFGSTNCALPMLDALKQGLEVDCFIVLTDSETNYGTIHPCKALERYRRKTGRNAKLVVVAMEGNRFTIADPKDPLTLDVVGFDTSVPQALEAFLAQ